MVRRVGFGDDDPEQQKTSVADRAMERHRAKARLKGDAEKTGGERNRRSLRSIIFTSVFIILWLSIYLSVMLNFVQNWHSDSILPLVFVTGVTVLAVSKSIKQLIKLVRGTPHPGNRPKNF